MLAPINTALPKLSTYIIDFTGPYIGAYLAVVAYDKLEAVRFARSNPLGKEIPMVINTPEFTEWVKDNVTELELVHGSVHTIWDGEY